MYQKIISRKILINGITLANANITRLLLRIKYWQKMEMEITFFGNQDLKDQIDAQKIINDYNFIEFQNTQRVNNKIHLTLEYLRRNLLALPFVFRFRHKFDVVYSSSSVLDCLIFGYLMKKADKKIKWAAVFDNIVPISDAGNKLIRFLGWVFFRISLILLKEADVIFAGSKDLEQFLIKKEFDKEKIIERGQAVRNDMIKRSVYNPRYNIDALFIGRINETKGIFEMLKVLKLVKEKYPDFQLAIMGVGDAPIMRKYHKAIREMKLKKNIQFLGYQSEKNKFTIIKSSKVFWFLSVSASESWGIALHEAVASGKPAFVYDLPAYQYYKNGEVFRFRIYDYASMADKVIDIFNKKEFDNKNGKLLVDKYDWERIAAIELNYML